MSDEAPFEGTEAEPKQLRNLRLLVNLLTLTMILGMVIIVAIIVMRFSGVFTVSDAPDEVTIPAVENATAVTKGEDWIAVVTTDDMGRQRIRLFTPSGEEFQIIDVIPAEAR